MLDRTVIVALCILLVGLFTQETLVKRSNKKDFAQSSKSFVILELQLDLDLMDSSSPRSAPRLMMSFFPFSPQLSSAITTERFDPLLPSAVMDSQVTP